MSEPKYIVANIGDIPPSATVIQAAHRDHGSQIAKLLNEGTYRFDQYSRQKSADLFEKYPRAFCVVAIEQAGLAATVAPPPVADLPGVVLARAAPTPPPPQKLYDGLTAEQCLARYETALKEEMPANRLHPALSRKQRDAAQAQWTINLRAKVKASKEADEAKERAMVLVDREYEAWE